MQVGGIYEQRDAQSVTYILEDASLFFPTGYKVLKSQEGKGFVKCNHLTHNGKDKLVYDISKYKTLISLATTFDSVAFLSVFINLLDSLINAKNNGFMQYDNIDLTYENIYVDCNNFKVYLIYIPINVGMVNNDVAYFIERFRYATSSFLENYFDNPDENIIYINSVITSSQYNLEEMKYMLQEKLNAINSMNNSNNFNGLQNENNNFNNINNNYNNLNDTSFNNYNNSSQMNNMQGRPSLKGAVGMSPVGNLGGVASGRYNNNPMRNSGGDVRETMDISDILKQIKNNGYYDEIGENTCFEESERFEKPRNNRLNLGGTPGSLSKANALGINNLSNSGVIPNVKNLRNHDNGGRNTDSGRYDSYDKNVHNRNMGSRGSSNRGIDNRQYDDRHYNDVGYDIRDIDDRDRYSRESRRNDRMPNSGSSRNSRGVSRSVNNSSSSNSNRTINATIRLVSSEDCGEIELIIDKEEFLIGKNFNVVDGFIPYNEGISRVHCKIVYDRDSYNIVDLGSLNGTYVNGARIPVKSQVPISVGDRIGIANIEFTVETV